MPRKARLLLPDACYHVMIRGNQKRPTFIDENDYREYLNIVLHYKNKYSLKLYAYCLMPNHIHLVTQVKEPNNLPKSMQGISLAYTIWFNEKYKKVGHLWQGRYKNMVIQKDQYLLDCINYVECNPVRANLSKSPMEYPWSSWRSRIMQENNKLLDQLPSL